MMDGGMMMGWMLIWPLLVLVGLALLGYVAFRLARGGTAGRSSPARRILDERYARGEIDEDEYQRRRDGLR